MTQDAAGVVLERTVELAEVRGPPLDEADRSEYHRKTRQEGRMITCKPV